MGWRLQIFAPLNTLIELRNELNSFECPIILDHFAGVIVQKSNFLAQIQAIQSLYSSPNIIIKLAAPYIVSPDKDVVFFSKLIQNLADMSPDRLIWGSNWQHPSGGDR